MSSLNLLIFSTLLEVPPTLNFPGDNNVAVFQSSAFSHTESRWDEDLAECIGKGDENCGQLNQ